MAMMKKCSYCGSQFDAALAEFGVGNQHIIRLDLMAEGGEAAEQPHVGSVTVHRAHDIDQIVVDQIMGKEKQ